MRTRMTLEAEVTAVIMPGTVRSQISNAVYVYWRIGSSYSVEIVMTSTPRAGWIVCVMARGAVFGVGLSGAPMSTKPGEGRVIQGVTIFASVAGITK